MKNIYLVSTAFLIVFFLLPVRLLALPEPVWHSGQLLLTNRATLEGDLSYNWSTEIVLFRQFDGRVRAFSASQVQEFGWFDYSQHKQRNFVSITAQVNNHTKPGFFEICMDGALAVVRKLRGPHGLLKRLFSHPTYYNDQPTLAQNSELFMYYVYDAGHLRALDRFHIEIYEPLMTAYDRELQHFVLTHNLNDHTLLGRLVLIDHFNFLVQQDPKTASARAASNVQE